MRHSGNLTICTDGRDPEPTLNIPHYSRLGGRLGVLAALAALAWCAEAWCAEDGATRADWPHYGGAYTAWRYSALGGINRGNVHKLAPAWVFQDGRLRKWTPVDAHRCRWCAVHFHVQ
jgi:hypothetical protein